MTTYHPDPSHGHSNGQDNRSLADAAREEFENRRAQAGEAADVARRQVRETTQRASDQSAQFVRDNPALALAGAVGVGILLGLTLRNRG